MIKRSINQFIASDEQPMVVLIDENRIPLFYPNIYAATKYRSLGRSPATTEKVLRCISKVHSWAAINQLDIEESILYSDFLNVGQLQDLAFFLRLNEENQDQIHTSKFEKQRLNTKQIARQIENLIYLPKTQKDLKPSVSNEEGAFRIRTTYNYLKFLLRRSNHCLSKDKYHDIEQRLESFKELAPKVSRSSDKDALEGMSLTEKDILLDLIKPENPNNPFRNDFLKHRNQLIFKIYLSAGLRRSELRFLKIEDIGYTTHIINVRVSKTVSRKVKCSSDVCEYFHNFITKYLSQIPYKNRKHGYLFTTETGQHLSNDAINLMFRTLRDAANISTDITPHTMRRTWNDALSYMIDELPVDQRPTQEEEKQIRNRLMGWSSISEMSSQYARRSIREKADEIAELLANTINKKSGTENANKQ